MIAAGVARRERPVARLFFAAETPHLPAAKELAERVEAWTVEVGLTWEDLVLQVSPECVQAFVAPVLAAAFR